MAVSAASSMQATLSAQVYIATAGCRYDVQLEATTGMHVSQKALRQLFRNQVCLCPPKMNACAG